MRPRVVALLQPYLGAFLSSWIVPGYAAMLTIGCVLASILVVEEARKIGVRAVDSLSVMIATYVGGIAGAASIPVLQGVAGWVSTGHFALPTGMHAYGGLIGGLVGGVLALRRAHVPVAPFLDVVAPAIGLGYFFARIGCFLAGCDYGELTSMPFAVLFPPGSHAFVDHLRRGYISPSAESSLPVHPTQLYSCLVGLVLYAFASALPRRGDGSRYVAVVVSYGALRSVVEVFRGDASRGSIGPLSTSQALAFATSVIALVLFVRYKQRNPTTHLAIDPATSPDHVPTAPSTRASGP